MIYINISTLLQNKHRNKEKSFDPKVLRSYVQKKNIGNKIEIKTWSNKNRVIPITLDPFESFIESARRINISIVQSTLLELPPVSSPYFQPLIFRLNRTILQGLTSMTALCRFESLLQSSFRNDRDSRHASTLHRI